MKGSMHVAVMTQEAIEALGVRPGGRYIDATLGGGTHTEELLRRSAPDGHVLSLDLDPKALERGRQRFRPYGQRWIGVEANFRDLERVAKENGFFPADGILFDLGFSSDTLSDPDKGLSFQVDGPLDMRLGPMANADGLTAADIVNSWKEREIADLIREYGEERYAGRIAAAIVKARKSSRILRTVSLAGVVSASVPASYERGRIHPATRTFQALRIAVNDELASLKEGIAAAVRTLAPAGRLAIISFHSLEDRIVKRAFKESPDLTPIFKKPLMPKDDETAANPRARSAKLRAAVKSRPNTKNTKYVAHVRHVPDQAP